MLIFSTIAAVLAPVIYLIPFVILWKKGIEVYTTPKTEKVIKNKHIFIAKIIFLIVLTIAFVFTWSTKVMFYPGKVCIFIAILLFVEIMTFFHFLVDDDGHDRMEREFNNISVSFWAILLILAGISGCMWANASGTQIPTGPVEHSETLLEVEHISSSGNVFFYKEAPGAPKLKVISINDDNVRIEITGAEKPYLEEYTYSEGYTMFGDKKEKIYIKEGTYSVNYVLYISESDLYQY